MPQHLRMKYIFSPLLSYKATQTSLRFSQFEVSCWRTKLRKQVYVSLSLKSAAVGQSYSNKSTLLSVWSQLLLYKATQKVYVSLSLKSAAVVQSYSNKSAFLSVWSQLLSYKATQTSLRFCEFEVIRKNIIRSLSRNGFPRRNILFSMAMDLFAFT